jgi:hypothetical protein
VSSALGPLTSVALPDAVPCRSVLQMDLPVGTGQDLQLRQRSCEPRRSSWDLDCAALEELARPSLPRKEVIQPQLPLRLPCYDFVPITSPTLGRCPPVNRVGPRTSGVTSFHDVTGGVYKAREHIHRPVLTGGY